MSPTTNTNHSVASESPRPLSRSGSSDWVLVNRAQPSNANTTTSQSTSTSNTSSAGHITRSPSTIPTRRDAQGPSTVSTLRARSPTALRRSERRHNLQAAASGDIPADVLGSRVSVLPASAIQIYTEGSRPPQEPPSTPASRTIQQDRRSHRTGASASANSITSPIRRRNHTVRDSIMISFTPSNKDQGFLEPYHTAYTTYAGSSKSTLPVEETVYATSSTRGPLHVRAKVVLDNGLNRVEMVGGPRTGSAYSLAGHVVLTVPNLTSPYAPLNMTCKTHIRQIKRLRVAFEGKSEFHDDAGRYQVTQLCRVEKSLTNDSSDPQLLEHSGPSTSPSVFQDSTTYAIAFDLTIPGWLPASISDDLTTTSYGVLCDAEIGWVSRSGAEDMSPLDVNMETGASSTSVSSLPIPIGSGLTAASRFLPRLAKSVATALTGSPVAQWDPSHNRAFQSEWQSVQIVRHRASPTTFNSLDANGNSMPQTVNHNEIALRHFTLKPSEDSPSPIECMVSTPEIVDLNGPSLRVSVRLRARRPASSSRAQPPAEASQAIPAGFMRSTDENGDVDMDMDDAAGNPDSNLPTAASHRPPQRVPTSIIVEDRVKMVELGMEVEEVERYSSEPTQSFTSSFPVPETQPDLTAGSTPFDQSNAFLSPPSPYARMSLLGLSTQTPGKVNRSRSLLLGEDGKARTYRFEGDGFDLGNGWRKVNIVIPLPSRDASSNGTPMPRAELETPHLKLKHKLKIKLICKSANSVGAETVVCLTTPLRMSTSTSLPRRSLTSAGLSITHLAPLPAYNQIFHENGAVREDDDPLPLYEPPANPAMCDNGGSLSIAAHDLSTDSREAMDIEDRDEVLRTVTADDTPGTSSTAPWPAPVSARTAEWPASPSSTPSLIHTPLSSQLYTPFSSFASVPEPRFPRSMSPASFEDSAGLAFGTASPDFLAEGFGLPGYLGEETSQSRIHEGVTGHPMVTRAKVAGALARLHKLS